MKSERWHRLCAEHEGYRQAWDEGRGPGQERQPVEPEVKSKRAEAILKRVAQTQRLVHAMRFVMLPSDRGIGDVAARLVADRRKNKTVDKIRALLRQCGCQRQQSIDELNRRFPA